MKAPNMPKGLVLDIFNKKSAKTECEIKVGVRRDDYGNSRFVRGGKEIGVSWADGSKDSHGAEVRLNGKRQSAIEEKEKRRNAATEANKMRTAPRL